MLSISQYARFAGVGAFVGVFTIGVRSLVGYLLTTDTRVNYSISVVLAYAAGIVLSYALNHRLTFRNSNRPGSVKKFLLFVSVALVGLASTWLLSITLRYGGPLHLVFGSAAATVAFAVATVLSSLLTYPLNAVFVFREPQRYGARITT